MINDYENSLRTLIILILGSDDPSKYKVSEDRINKWIEKREIEEKKYKGVLIERRLIYYSDFYDLGNIIKKNWEKFKDVFHEKKRFEVHYSHMETFRNTVAHGRELLSYQKSLVDGISGMLKTEIVKYHNRNMNADDFFIKILKISDSLGSVYERGENKRLLAFDAENILRVDDELEIIAEAFDPKGREITYSLSDFGGQRFDKIKNKTGRFLISITSNMVKKKFVFHLKAITESSEYENEDFIQIHYTILP